MSRRYYVRNMLVPFEEDFTHEFKGHRNLCCEDLPPWTQANNAEKRSSRKAVSRTLNAFLNTGQGGKVYLGVIDSGEAKGLSLTKYQKDHVLLSLIDTMGRYKPPVKQHRYSVKFVPIYDTDEEGRMAVKTGHKRKEGVVDQNLERQQHALRSHEYCWCDKDSAMLYNAGIIAQDYVIEIKIKPWDPYDELNASDGCGSIVNIQPIHENEEGLSFFRRQACLVQYTMAEIAQLTKQEVQKACKDMINKLKEDIKNLKIQVSGDGSGSNG